MRYLIVIFFVIISYINIYSQSRNSINQRNVDLPRKTLNDRAQNSQFAEIAEGFQINELKIGTDKMVYCTKSICFSDTSSQSLFIYLHGNSGKTKAGKSYLQCRPLVSLYNYLTEHKVNSVILAPQCPQGTSWKEVLTNVIDVIDHILTEYDIDNKRIYVIGTSAGAGGAASLVSTEPRKYAAALIASGGLRNIIVDQAVETPLYITAGEFDLADYHLYENLTKEIKGKGGDVRFVMFEGQNHHESTDAAVSPESIEFLLEHIK